VIKRLFFNISFFSIGLLSVQSGCCDSSGNEQLVLSCACNTWVITHGAVIQDELAI